MDDDEFNNLHDGFGIIPGADVNPNLGFRFVGEPNPNFDVRFVGAPNQNFGAIHFVGEPNPNINNINWQQVIHHDANGQVLNNPNNPNNPFRAA